MAERNKLNKVFIVGTVVEVNTQVREGNGKKYVNGKVVIKTTINDVENLIDCKVLAFEKTKSGEISKMFTNYCGLDGYLNKRVRVSAELAENFIPDQTNGTLKKFNQVNLKFINPAKSDDVDTATFEFNGFVVKPIYERKNKDDETIGYRIEIAQANYNNSNIQVIRFDVNAQDVNIVNAIEANYEAGATVEISGMLSSISTTETRTEEVAFGEPVVKTFVNTNRQYRITGGKEVIGEESPDYYPPEEIKQLVAAYKQADVERLAKAKEKEVGGEPETAPAQNSMASKIRTSSLI